MTGTGIMVGICTSPYTSPHTQLKKSGIPNTHTQSMREFPSKQKRIQAIPTGTDLFAISSHEEIR